MMLRGIIHALILFHNFAGYTRTKTVLRLCAPSLANTHYITCKYFPNGNDNFPSDWPQSHNRNDSAERASNPTQTISRPSQVWFE